MNILRLVIITTVIIGLASCGSRTYRLSETDFDWMPYKGKDTLIFTSTDGDTDTLFLKNGNRNMEYEVNPLSVRPPDSTEAFEVSYQYNFFDTAQQLYNFRVFPLIILKRTKERTTAVGFYIITDDASFCGLKYFEMEYLNRQKLTILQTSLREYHDVFIFEPDFNCSEVSKIYWSKSNGLVRFDKINGSHYTLTKKYSNFK